MPVWIINDWARGMHLTRFFYNLLPTIVMYNKIRRSYKVGHLFICFYISSGYRFMVYMKWGSLETEIVRCVWFLHVSINYYISLFIKLFLPSLSVPCNFWPAVQVTWISQTCPKGGCEAGSFRTKFLCSTKIHVFIIYANFVSHLLILQLKDCRSLYEGYVPMKYKKYYKKISK